MAAAIAAQLLEQQKELELFFGQEEWDAICNDTVINEILSRELELSIRRQLFLQKNPRKIKHIIRPAVWFASAAIVCCMAFGITRLLQQHKNAGVPVVVNNRIPLPKIKRNDNYEVDIKTIHNTGSKPMQLQLADGSSVTLFAKTTLAYPVDFTGSTRELALNGDAFFQVAKDKHKPFIVHTGHLFTTALGTSFRITAFHAGTKNIQVKLFTGKVVIKSTRTIPNWKEDVFLLPGQQMIYNQESSIVGHFPEEKNKAKKSTGPETDKPGVNDLHFNGNALPDVFRQLETMYTVNIHFNTADVIHMNFTGSVSKTDDPAMILKAITQMNGLKLSTQADGFTIGKLPQP